MPPGAGAAVYWETLETNGNGLEERMERWEEELARRGSSLDATWSGFDRKEMERLRAFRHAVPELVNHRVARFRQASPGIRKIGSDAAVPAAAFESFFDAVRTQLENSGIETVIFGHLGDCHLHFNMVPHDSGELERALEIYERIMDDAVAAGGTVSAEHGIGKLKIPYLSRMYPPEAVEDMKNTKRVLDPMGIMNRGTLLA
jgi:D-lactate dehydrogenase (cytochrome)